MVEKFQVHADGTATEIQTVSTSRRTITGFSLNGPEEGNHDVVDVATGRVDGEYIAMHTSSGDELELRANENGVTQDEFNAIRAMIHEAVAPIQDKVNLTAAETRELIADYVAIERAARDAIER